MYRPQVAWDEASQKVIEKIAARNSPEAGALIADNATLVLKLGKRKVCSLVTQHSMVVRCKLHYQDQSGDNTLCEECVLPQMVVSNARRYQFFVCWKSIWSA